MAAKRGLQPDVPLVLPNEAADALVASDRQRLGSFLRLATSSVIPLPVRV
jgi:hypothetical protein